VVEREYGLTSNSAAQLYYIKTAAAYRTAIGPFYPGFQAVVVEDVAAGKQLRDQINILIAMDALWDGRSIRCLAIGFKVRSWHGIGGDGKRIAGAFAKVS
jgi:hypothetical protein